jgi:hypothetical protein
VVSVSTGLVFPAPTERALRVCVAGLGAWLGLGVIGLVVGAPASFVGGLLAAPLVASVHVVVLTLPGLLVAQASLGLAARPSETLEALGSGLRQGVALLVAALPLVLFFGVSLGTPWHVAWLSYGAGELALMVTLAQAVRTLLGTQPGPRESLVYGTFGVTALVVGTMAGADTLRWVGGAL